jgi:hypothetical protein
MNKQQQTQQQAQQQSSGANGPVRPPIPVVEPEPFIGEVMIGLTFADIANLEPYLYRNIHSKDDLIKAIHNLSTVAVNGVAVSLEPGLLARLRSRCIPASRDFSQFMAETVKTLLKGWVGY